MSPRSAARACSILAIVALLAPSFAIDLHAEPMGSPASILKKKQWVFGLSSGGFFGRGMDGGTDVSVFSIGHYRGYGLTDRLSLYGKIGGAWIDINDAVTTTKQSLGGNILASAQLKTRIWNSPSRRWEWDGSAQYVYMHAKRRQKSQGTWKEMQVASSVACALGRFKPYLGGKVSVAELGYLYRKDGAIVQQGTYKSDNPIGAFFGTDIAFGEEEQMVINIESGYLNGPELDFSVNYVF